MKRNLNYSLVILSLLIAACNPPLATDLAPATPPKQLSPPAAPSDTSDTIHQDCYFNWATQPLPDLSAQVQAAMDGAGLRGVTAIAEAYGENCYDAKTNAVLYFAALETDFRLTVEVESLKDKRSLGDLLERILTILDNFPAETTPGPQPGYVGVTFRADDEALRLWFRIEDGESARARGLKGEELFEALQKK